MDATPRVFGTEQSDLVLEISKNVEKILELRKDARATSRKFTAVQDLLSGDELLIGFDSSFTVVKGNEAFFSAMDSNKIATNRNASAKFTLVEVALLFDESNREDFLRNIACAHSGKKVSSVLKLAASEFPGESIASECILAQLDIVPEYNNLGVSVGIWLRLAPRAQQTPQATAAVVLPHKNFLVSNSPKDYGLFNLISAPIAVLSKSLEPEFSNSSFQAIFKGLVYEFKEILLQHVTTSNSGTLKQNEKMEFDVTEKEVTFTFALLLNTGNTSDASNGIPAKNALSGDLIGIAKPVLESRTFCFHLVPFLIDEGERFLCYAEDVSLVVEAVENAEFERARLFHHAKLATLGEMAGGIAHEINNPLTIIKGKVDILKLLMERDKYDKARFEKDLTFVEATVDRIGKIVRGLKSFVRQSENDPMDPCCISHLFEDVLSFCQDRFLHDSVTLVSRFSEEVEFECRSAQIGQILVNLLSNSFDAVRSLDEKWVRLEGASEGDFLKITVTDSGYGIPKEVVSKMMDPYFTTKRLNKGNGLGLSISAGIAKDHGGSLVYNAESVNTQFVLTLPLRQAAEYASDQKKKKGVQGAA